MDKLTTALAAPKHVGVLGTGQYASAFARRLLTAGYSVTLGSRYPHQRSSLQHPKDAGDSESALGDVRVTSLEDCVTGNNVIVVALHADHFRSVFTEDLARLCAGKTLVDVSNRSGGRGSGSDGTESNAHLLQSFVPDAAVVKAFNSVSAYVMENDVTAGGPRVVEVASNNVKARAAVCALARDLGFDPCEKGGLRNAWQMEESVLTVLPEWKVAAWATLLLLIFWLLFAVGRFYLADNKLKWDQLPLKIMNKVFGATTLSLLALTYFPSTCAAFLQMAYGSKHRRFPGWIDAWLKARKQLGLVAFSVISLHVLISTVIINPTYVSSLFRKEDIHVKFPTNLTQDVVVHLEKTWMTWIGELSVLAGILAFALMSLLAVTSLPSVMNSLNWAEWRLVHSRLGYIMLALAVTHVCVMGMSKWIKTGFPLLFFRVKFLSIVMPSLVLVCKLVLLLPCVNTYVERIRRGWERKPLEGSEEKQSGSTLSCRL